jgi:hypothetical protein
MNEKSLGPGHGRSVDETRQRVSAFDFKKLGLRIAQACPLIWTAISGKRYIVPNHRQGDYYNQEALDHLMAFFLATYCAGDYGPKPDHVMRLMYLSSILALKEQRPIYYLERELGEALMRTQLPGDLVTDDIHWRRGHMRIMMPRGLISVEREGHPRRDVMYLDIGKAKAQEVQRLQEPYFQELRFFALMHGRLRSQDIPTTVFDKDGLMVCTQLSGAGEDQDLGLNYGVVRPFEGRKIKDIKVGEHFDTCSVCDETDDALMDRMEHLAVNILLFMGSVPLEYEPTEAPIRKIRQVNDRIIPALWSAKFVGRSQYRPSQKPHYHQAQFTGRKMPKHWRAGHWKRQHFGPKWGESKLIWIEPYETYGPEELAEAKA